MICGKEIQCYQRRCRGSENRKFSSQLQFSITVITRKIQINIAEITYNKTSAGIVPNSVSVIGVIKYPNSVISADVKVAGNISAPSPCAR